MKRIITIFALACLLVSCGVSSDSHQPTANPKAENAIAYLKSEVPEVQWLTIDGNNAYVGFHPIPKDWNIIIKAAALKANKATDFGFHVWAIDASKYPNGWSGDGSYIGEVTARGGKIE